MSISVMKGIGNRIGGENGAEYAKAIENRVRNIIKNAPITNQLKDEIVEHMRANAMVGLPTDITFEALADEFYYLDLNNPASGGIFDTSRAPEIDRKGITRALGQIKIHEKVIERINPDRAKMFHEEELQKIAQRRQDFERIHKKPVTNG